MRRQAATLETGTIDGMEGTIGWANVFKGHPARVASLLTASQDLNHGFHASHAVSADTRCEKSMSASTKCMRDSARSVVQFQPNRGVIRGVLGLIVLPQISTRGVILVIRLLQCTALSTLGAVSSVPITLIHPLFMHWCLMLLTDHEFGG